MRAHIPGPARKRRVLRASDSALLQPLLVEADGLLGLGGLTGHELDVKVDPQFVRANEIHRLCGDPSRLQAVAGPLPTYTLRETLAWMLE